MNKYNKTISNIFIFINFILECQKFQIKDVLEFFEKQYKIVLKKETILKYIRTLKSLGFDFKRPDNQTYSLTKIPTYFDNSQTETNYNKCLEIIKNYQITYNADTNNNLVEKLSLFLQKTSVPKEIAKKNKNIEKIKYYIADNKRIKIDFLTGKDKTTSITAEIENLFLEKGLFYIKVFDILKREYLTINTNLISKMEQTASQNRYIYLKFPAKLKFSKKFINSYLLKEGETIIRKEQDFVYIKSFFTDKKSFFNNILRYRENCEIIAPKELRDDFCKYLSDLYQKYDCPNKK